jgi:hypothetical protein
VIVLDTNIISDLMRANMKTYGLTHEQLAMGLGRAARMAGKVPARHLQGADQPRRRSVTKLHSHDQSIRHPAGMC